MSRTLRATCPTCGQSGMFHFHGTQHWPQAVVSQYGLPEVIGLWTCQGCQTTLSEFELLPPHAQTAQCQPALPQHAGLGDLLHTARH